MTRSLHRYFRKIYLPRPMDCYMFSWKGALFCSPREHSVSIPFIAYLFGNLAMRRQKLGVALSSPDYQNILASFWIEIFNKSFSNIFYWSDASRAFRNVRFLCGMTRLLTSDASWLWIKSTWSQAAFWKRKRLCRDGNRWVRKLSWRFV